jgi:1-acyl-sn-glycerol-3-phosphate acyltransferase
VLIQSVNARVVRWMMAKEFYDGKALNWVFRAVEAIPVARSGRDMAAMRQAMRVLERDEVLGVFPEGRIEKSRELLPFQTGVALLAIKTHAPVYPVYLDGTQRESDSMLVACLKPNRAVIAFGPPVEFDRTGTDRDSLERATDKIRQAIESLRDQVVARKGVAVRITRPELRNSPP